MPGRLVYEGVIEADREVINTGQLSTGAYLLQLTDKEGNRSVRTVVKK
jgi:hypothetical protein